MSILTVSPAQGPQGIQGLRGTQGFQGSGGLGNQGPQGNVGGLGNQGPQGFQGFQGNQGVASAVRQGPIKTIVKSVVSSANAIPLDSTIPQIGEGASYTSVLFTPLFSDSVINIRLAGTFYCTAQTSVIIALFIDGAADSVAATFVSSTLSNAGYTWVLDHKYAPGSTAQITYELRFGRSSSGTVSLPSSATYLGTAGPLVAVEITEVAP